MNETATQPHNGEAEMAVLAGLMFHNSMVVQVQDWLKASDFYFPDHGSVYQAIMALSEAGNPADAVTVSDWLYSSGEANAKALSTLAMEIGIHAYTAANVLSYAEVIVGHSRMRSFMDKCARALERAQAPRGASAEDLSSALALSLAEIAPARSTGLRPYRDALMSLRTQMEDRYHNGTPIGLDTPWEGVNKAIGGLRAGEVAVIAARSNAGKSVMGLQLARYNGKKGNKTALFSMEMMDADVAARDVAAEGSVPFSWVIGNHSGGEDDNENWQKVGAGFAALMEASIVLDDSAGLDATQIAARAKRSHAQAPLTLVVVDHLHDMALPGKQGEVIERAQALRDLKKLAKQLKIPVVVLAQLNRGGAEGNRPTITDIRGSGGIEEVADLILFIHRPDQFNPNDRPGLVEVIVGKGRNVQTGTVVSLQSQYSYQRMVNWEGEIPQPVQQAQPMRSAASGLAPKLGRKSLDSF